MDCCGWLEQSEKTVLTFLPDTSIVPSTVWKWGINALTLVTGKKIPSVMGTRREWFLDSWYKLVHYLFQSKSVGAVIMKNWSALCRINVSWCCASPKAFLTYKTKESFYAHFTLRKVSDERALPRRLTESGPIKTDAEPSLVAVVFQGKHPASASWCYTSAQEHLSSCLVFCKCFGVHWVLAYQYHHPFASCLQVQQCSHLLSLPGRWAKCSPFGIRALLASSCVQV